jgi:hypothetical protein
MALHKADMIIEYQWECFRPDHGLFLKLSIFKLWLQFLAKIVRSLNTQVFKIDIASGNDWVRRRWLWISVTVPGVTMTLC